MPRFLISFISAITLLLLPPDRATAQYAVSADGMYPAGKWLTDEFPGKLPEIRIAVVNDFEVFGWSEKILDPKTERRSFVMNGADHALLRAQRTYDAIVVKISEHSPICLGHPCTPRLLDLAIDHLRMLGIQTALTVRTDAELTESIRGMGYAGTITPTSVNIQPQSKIPSKTKLRLKHVHSIQDFKHHFELHIQRVETLAIHVLELHPEEFPLVTRDLASAFLKNHDVAKIQDDAAFRKKHWTQDRRKRGFLSRLYEKYAINIKLWAEPHRSEIFQVIGKLNEADKSVAMSFFKERGLLQKDGTLSASAEQLLRLEKIADVVDRNSDPIAREELAIMKQVPMTLFIPNLKDQELCLELKSHYSQVIPEHLIFGDTSRCPELLKPGR